MQLLSPKLFFFFKRFRLIFFNKSYQFWINRIFVLTKVLCLGDQLLRVQNGCNKMVTEIQVMKFFGLKSVLSLARNVSSISANTNEWVKHGKIICFCVWATFALRESQIENHFVVFVSVENLLVIPMSSSKGIRRLKCSKIYPSGSQFLFARSNQIHEGTSKARLTVFASHFF